MTTTASTRSPRRLWWAGWATLALSAAAIAAYSVPAYLTGDPAQSRLPLNPDVALHYLSIAVHALPAGLVLLLGPLQFVPALRNRYRALHRVIGRVYMVSVVFASVAAVLATTFSVNGFSAQVAFYLLTAAWLYSLTQAYRTIRRGQVRLHRVWMIRNYALSFAAVLLRVFLLLGLAARSRYEWLTVESVYTTSAWASILISAGVAEWFIVQRSLAARR
ncbi:hypothetical protein A6A06_08545 [Streptomyces sp. CB02923]|uniref:DUF2306 domain-containing protein n=1 Tax=Streptomyces sp. CB02923 TaxID=1718985 RepID=UPI00093E5DD0|nr:DUF2306 domain-containing protein [Streptomyces sp. CB02923]OKI04769.1 hypothetical protein A6A06_08545 [Streptomyces sp. CB02923]